jgi:aerobic carbon-monoxide dehydrogenase medium subunit
MDRGGSPTGWSRESGRERTVAKVVTYHRPASLEQAVALLAGPATIALRGGGMPPVPDGREEVAVVDLQALGLDTIEPAGDGRLRLGGGARLQDLADHPAVPAGLRDLARREAPSSLRTLWSVGDVVARGHGESELVAGLLVHDAVATVATVDGTTQQALSEVLGHPLDAAVVLAITIETGGRVAVSRTGRTPADRAIVAAVARRPDGGATRLALTGVASTPVLVDGPAGLARLRPPGDFRGSAEYRRHLAHVHATRAQQEVA